MKHFELVASGVKRAAEAVRMLGSFERLEMARKRELLNVLLDTLEQNGGKRAAAWLWSLGRLLSRVPLYAAEERVNTRAKIIRKLALLRVCKPAHYIKDGFVVGLEEAAASFPLQQGGFGRDVRE